MPLSSGAEDGQPGREAQAFNASIYLLLGMPYLLLGTLGFLIYRGLRNAAPADCTAAEWTQPPEGDPPCPLPSADETS